MYRNEDPSPNNDQKSSNLKTIKLIIYQDFFIMEFDASQFLPAAQPIKMIIDCKTANIYEIDMDLENPQQQIDKISHYSIFLGMINIDQKWFLVFSEEVNEVCEFDKDYIYELQTPCFIGLENTENVSQSQNEQLKDIQYQIQNIQKLMSFGYYFSFSYDLTLNLQKRSQQQQTHQSFIWNSNLFKEMRKQNVSERWNIPIMQGFIGQIKIKLDKKREMNYLLISRRSSKRAGTRYNARGIDDQGHVANFVENEQIVKINDIMVSHVQIRGSVPIFFEQTGITAKTQLTRNFEMTDNVFRKHFKLLLESYQNIMCVNLMAKFKKGEQLLTDVFETHIKELSQDWAVKYEFFDFHTACQGQQFDRSNPLIEKFSKIGDQFGFYFQDNNKQIYIQNQKGVFRTNCLDCLDRTNFIQTKLAAYALDQMLISIEKYLGVKELRLKLYDNQFYEEIDRVQGQSEFCKKFKNLWADNGDIISKHYTGTGSTHTNITRQGKRDIFGLIDHGIKSIGRFYIQNFEDHIKQQTINHLLGQNLQENKSDNTFSILDEQVKQSLQNRQHEYYEYQDIDIMVINWNLNNEFTPTDQYELNQKIFQLPQNVYPDFILLSLQKIDLKSLDQWDHCLRYNISKLTNSQEYKYVLIYKKNANEVATYIFALDKYIDRISGLQNQNIKFSNSRAALQMKFKIDDSCFSFINTELDSYQFNNRILEIEEIHEHMIGENEKDYDYSIVAGSLNFQLLLQEQDSYNLVEKIEYIDELINRRSSSVQNSNKKQLKYMNASFLRSGSNESQLTGIEREKIKKEIDNRLLKFDELGHAQQYSTYLKKYVEAPIYFLPCSTFNKYSILYQQKDEQLQISYNQRILMWNMEQRHIVKQYIYKKLECIESVHRPVVAYYSLPVKKEIISKRDEIIRQICQELLDNEEHL